MRPTNPDGTALVLRLGVALYRYSVARSWQRQAFGLLVPAVRRPDAGADPALFAAALVTAALTACWVDTGAARHLAEQAVQVTRQLGDDRLISRALATLCTACHYAGEPETGRPFGQESAERARRLGDNVQLAESLAHYVLTIDPARSLQLVGEAIACTERSGDHLYNCLLHNNAGFQALSAGDIPAARAYLEAVARAAQQIGWESAELPANLGLILHAEEISPAPGPCSKQACGSAAGTRTAEAWPTPAFTWRAWPPMQATGPAGAFHGSAQVFQDRTGIPWDEFDARYRQDSLAQTRARMGMSSWSKPTPRA